MNQEWKPSNKYEVAPGLFIGSEIGDVDREVKGLTRQWLDGDEEAFIKIQRLQDRRIDLMRPKNFEKTRGILESSGNEKTSYTYKIYKTQSDKNSGEFKNGFMSGLTIGIMGTVFVMSIFAGIYLATQSIYN